MVSPSYWLASVTPVAPPTEANPKLKFLLYAGLVTGAWSGVLCLVVYLIARVLGVPFEVVSPASTTPQVVPWLLVLITPIVAALVAALLTSLLLGRRHAQRIVFWAGTLVAIVSCASPVLQPASTLWSTRMWLIVFHAITWFLVVPQLARIVGDSEPGMSLARNPAIELS